eukprot:TRINITY_DN58257_c0_g1_i1.p1 TRINITY_DN58257_c0_g1~~TRINITY_DN58257_c0_g1_i1.p1  ORF type:complete len:472 (-),score=48.15 TRINITY_DN58257_c0_g1_i1:87-1502(-)
MQTKEERYQEKLARKEEKRAAKMQKRAKISKVSYPVFSSEIASQKNAQAQKMKEEYKSLKAQLKEEHHNRNEQEIQQIKARLADLKVQKEAEKERIRGLRAQVKQELKQLRAVQKQQRRAEKAARHGEHLEKEKLEIVSSDADPWESRLPNMHKLFPAGDEKLRREVHQRVSAVWNNKDLKPTEAVASITAIIDELLDQSCIQTLVTDYGRMEAIINAVAEQGHFLRLIEAIGGDEELAKKVVANSHHHDLFDKLVLLKGANGWKLRLHVFLPDSFTESQEEIHSHRNHFVSKILYGAFAHSIWEETRLAADAVPVPGATEELAPEDREKVNVHKYVYDPLLTKEGERVFNVDKQGTVDLTKLAEVWVRAGVTYFMHTSVLHAVSMLDGCTLTCVLNAPQTNEKSCFSTYQPWENETFTRPAFTSEELMSTFKHVHSLLTEPQEVDVEPAKQVHRGEEREAKAEPSPMQVE